VTKKKTKLPAGGATSKKRIMPKKEQIRGAAGFDQLVEAKYGKAGVKARERFEKQAKHFIISELLKEARKAANMTQEQLAEKVGTKKSYISRLENGNCDIQLSTLYRIFEFGLGKKVQLTIK
jgi:HTH-type transcriptional regulator / antitoxin HipB